MRRFRDAITGLFISRDQADAQPNTTVAETVSDAPEVEAALRWRVQTLEAVMLEAAGELRTWAPHPRTVAAELERVARDRMPEENA